MKTLELWGKKIIDLPLAVARMEAIYNKMDKFFSLD